MALLLIALPPICIHALNHGQTAYTAYHHLSDYNPDDDPQDDDERYYRGTQEDGRTVHILRLPKLQGKPVTWAFVVVGGAYLVTCYLTQDRKYIERKKAECKECPRK